MKKGILFLILLTLSTNLLGQEFLFQKEIHLNSNFKYKRESLPVVNDQKKEILLFLLDNSQIMGLKFNFNYELIDDYVTDKPSSKFNVLLGHGHDSDGYHLYFTNGKKNIFFCETIDVDNKNRHGEQVIMDLRGEEFLESISYNQKFYLLTVKKKSSVLNIYVFQGATIERVGKFDFSSFKFSTTAYTRLFEVLLDDDGSPFNSNLRIQKIDNSDPNSLDLTSKRNKLYYYDNKIYLTLDNGLAETKLIRISLDDFSSSVSYFKQINIECDDTYKKQSNSFLLNDHLFQIKGCRNELGFQIQNIARDSLIKDYRVKNDEIISFKNTPLILEKSTRDTEKELDNTQQVLRKISSIDIGIAARMSQGGVELLIGGFKEVQRTSGGGPVFSPGTSISTPYGNVTTPPTYNYNTTMYGYNTYTTTRSVYFKSLFDKTEFNHIPGPVFNNVYDKIEEYTSSRKEYLSSETIFKVEDYYVFGYYNKRDKKYCLIKFIN